MSLFSLGDIDPLLVSRFSGFDRDSFVQRVRLLSDGATGPHELLQSSSVPARTAVITGTLTESADCDTFRGYHLSSEELTFTDGNDISYSVRVLELAIEDLTHWWTFSATLYCTDPDTVLGS